MMFFTTTARGRIVDFHTDIRVAKSGELMVTERITVEVKKEFPALERELPRDSRIVDVIRNGHPERHQLEETRLRIGKEPLASGRHLYQVSYRSARSISYLDGGYDELRWKLAGAERMTAEVTLPASVPRRDIRARAEGGEYQSFVRDGRAAFRAKEPITLVVRFPKDVVDEPADDRGLWAVLALLALAGAVLVRLQRLSAKV